MRARALPAPGAKGEALREFILASRQGAESTAESANDSIRGACEAAFEDS